MASENLGTKEVAKKLGVTAAKFRRLLRKMGKNTAGEYKRYEFKADSDLSKFKKALEEMTTRGEATKKKASKKKASSKKSKKSDEALAEVA